MAVSDAFRRLTSDRGLPSTDCLPWWLSPLPRWLENLGLRLVPVIIVINILGTIFGFWYYGFHPIPQTDPLITWQFASEPVIMWPFVPDSPLATLFIALAFLSWWRGKTNEYLAALAFFGCWKLGLWTPYVLTVFADAFLSVTRTPLYVFLLISHLGMVAEAFVLYRIADFPVRAVGVAVIWYGFNDIVDYFIPIIGDPHHTAIPLADTATIGNTTALHLAATGAVALTVIATFFALSTHIYKIKSAE
ncbi:DUF1405 domain-containing protein [Haloquadratum walsbyi]|uniref:Putative membrane protein n=1 Tax=Haloquadratum walsbyi J07HQW2 TaxID=1238425 RepID=U1MYH0_9EURY|nr:DUF1405 domain-containing protein [Haloquadratum walsbyi]ERG95539.1 MAG: putative membrane protein [Haloquadratum walsbyi J07HQW2]